LRVTDRKHDRNLGFSWNADIFTGQPLNGGFDRLQTRQPLGGVIVAATRVWS